jgi:hypothetical protein
VVGVWSDGDSESVPGGRQLLASGTAPLPVGPATAELHPDARVLSLDLSNTIPELDRNLEKADLGPITVSVTANGARSEVGRIEASAYDRAAYEARAGIVDVDLSPTLDLASLFGRGRLALEVQTPGGPAALLAERQLSASCEECNLYLDEGQSHTLVIRAHLRGTVPPEPLSVLVASYDQNMAFTNEATVLHAAADGTAELEVRGEAPGCRHLGFLAFTGAATPTPPPRLRLDTGQFTSVRTLPFDDKLEAATTDQAKHQLQGRGLAGAVWPQEPGHLALVDLEGEVIDGHDVTEALAEPLHGDDRHRRPSRSGARPVCRPGSSCTGWFILHRPPRPVIGSPGQRGAASLLVPR